MNLAAMLKRIEQQLASFETLHTDEIQRLEEKLATYRQLHADEVKMMKEELEELKKALAAQEEATPDSSRSQDQAHSTDDDQPAREQAAVTRRGFFIGGIGRQDS